MCMILGVLLEVNNRLNEHSSDSQMRMVFIPMIKDVKIYTNYQLLAVVLLSD